MSEDEGEDEVNTKKTPVKAKENKKKKKAEAKKTKKKNRQEGYEKGKAEQKEESHRPKISRRGCQEKCKGWQGKTSYYNKNNYGRTFRCL